jgi:hypothetical protein
MIMLPPVLPPPQGLEWCSPPGLFWLIWAVGAGGGAGLAGCRCEAALPALGPCAAGVQGGTQTHLPVPLNV